MEGPNIKFLKWKESEIEGPNTTLYLFFFWHVCISGGKEIRTSNFHFIRPDFSQLSYLLGTTMHLFNVH